MAGQRPSVDEAAHQLLSKEGVAARPLQEKRPQLHESRVRPQQCG